ncbi:MAG: pyrimidine dimer DNA glycosylase/endonuclease V [Nitrospirae bacterium]|nr:pyrimidine dimer DNA glycosylase/endonuclease V [Nitrospirota bacterium]
MRIWDISPDKLCRNHLLGEYNELHAMWNILTQGKIGYSNHPETKRWKGKLKALFRVHEEIVQEMLARGYNHKSPLDKTLAKGSSVQTSFVDPVERQREILREKGCSCNVRNHEKKTDIIAI